MKLTILAESHLLKSKKINGTIVQLYFLSKEFSKNNIDVYYIYNSEESNNIEELEDITLINVKNKSRFLSHFFQIYYYYKHLINIKPDYLYVRGRGINQFIAVMYCKYHKTSYIWNTNGSDSPELWKMIRRLFRGNKNLIKKLTLVPITLLHDILINYGIKKSKVIVNQTHDQKDYTKQLLSVNGTVIPNIFPVVKTRTKPKNQFLWLANLSRNKKPEIFIQIYKSLQNKNWTATLVGGTSDNAYFNYIRDECSSANIKFVGKVDFFDTHKYFNESKIYINTSDKHADGLPNAFLQAWNGGNIVISLNHDPNDWIKKHNIGYCAHGNVKLLISKLISLQANDVELAKMRENVLAFSKKKFSSEKIINQYINIFNNISS